MIQLNAFYSRIFNLRTPQVDWEIDWGSNNKMKTIVIDASVNHNWKFQNVLSNLWSLTVSLTKQYHKLIWIN